MVGPITLAVEGITDEAVIKRLLAEAGLQPGPVHGRNGKHALDRDLPGYDSAARYSRWLVLRDLDDDAPCAPALCRRLLPQPSPSMRLQIAVRAVEAWLLGDAESLSEFLSVSVHRIPSQPEALRNPKYALVEVARHSRRRAIRDEIVPPAGTKARVGTGYPAAVMEFANRRWRPPVAAAVCDSLFRLRRFLSNLATR